jgi:hypothetical protein
MGFRVRVVDNLSGGDVGCVARTLIISIVAKETYESIRGS